jgi:hypothetical protein
LGKLQDVKGNVRSVIDKLKGIKSDLVRGQGGWQDWDFPQLVKVLKMWKDINPIESSDDIKKKLPGHIHAILRHAIIQLDPGGVYTAKVKPTNRLPKWLG